MTASTSSFQAPLAPGTRACPPSLPAVPTSPAIRITSVRMARSRETSAFMLRATRSASPRSGAPSGEDSGIVRPSSPCSSARATAPVWAACQVSWSNRWFKADSESAYSPDKVEG